jgi:hypothetical protein
MASSINASTSGAGGVIVTSDASGILNLQSGGVTVATVQSSGLSLPSGSTFNAANTFGFKNRIINGGMVINQRNSTVTINTAGGRAYSVDRWAGETNSSGAFTIAQSSTAPAGFTYSTVATVTSTYATSGNTFAMLEQQIEGYNVADLGFGTSNAQAFTVSFWARSSVAGTYSAVLEAGSPSFAYVFNYTLTANTWTYVTQTIPALTTAGTFYTNNNYGLKLRISLYANGTLAGATGSWTSADYTGSTSQVNWLANAGATFYLTGVQIELGSQATSFDFRSYGTELGLCQRYYEVNGNMYCRNTGATAQEIRITWVFKVEKRTTPTITVGTGASTGVSQYCGTVYSSSVPAGSVYDTSAQLIASAEL